MKPDEMEFGTIFARAVKTAFGLAKSGRCTAAQRLVPLSRAGRIPLPATVSGAFKCALTGALAAGVMMTLPGTLSTQAQASPDVGYDEAPLIVMNDYGGLLRDRLRQIAKLRKESRPIEIRGGVCFSTCTMLLGLPNTCVSPRTVFGFHGPSSYGRSLDQATFEHASAVIASYYPEPLQEWYMTDARYTINGIRRVRGDNIIELGIASC